MMIKTFTNLAAKALPLALVTFLLSSPGLRAAEFGGVEFPQGAISFADQVVSYSPGTYAPTLPHQGAFNALGAPNYNGTNSCASQETCSFVSMGGGGSIVLQFTDNFLTGSGNSNQDLWIFEVGPAIEATLVDISKDGSIWFSVGQVSGATAGIDIDFYGFGATDYFSFVRLTDISGMRGATAGADIDAVGAIYTVPVAAIPEPEIYALMGLGFGLVGWVSRRRNRQAAG